MICSPTFAVTPAGAGTVAHTTLANEENAADWTPPDNTGYAGSMFFKFDRYSLTATPAAGYEFVRWSISRTVNYKTWEKNPPYGWPFVKGALASDEDVTDTLGATGATYDTGAGTAALVYYMESASRYAPFARKVTSVTITAVFQATTPPPQYGDKLICDPNRGNKLCYDVTTGKLLYGGGTAAS